jgi:hypothetical protein
MSTEQSAGVNAHHTHTPPTAKRTADEYRRHGTAETPVETPFVRPSDLLRPKVASRHDSPIERDERAGLVSPSSHIADGISHWHPADYCHSRKLSEIS